MDDYKQYIEFLAKKKDPAVFFNSGPDHAAIVMETLFKYSENKVRIFASGLKSAIPKDEMYIKELKGFLERKGILRVLLHEYSKANNPELFEMLANYKYFDPNQVIVKTTTVLVRNKETRRPVHFTVGDLDKYRMEEDTENYVAKGSFNDPTYAQKLINIFDKTFSDDSTEAMVLN